MILADGCQVTMKSKGKSSSLRVTFYDDIKDAKEKEERDKKHTLILNQTESEDPKDSLKSWAETLEKTIKSISSSKSKAESPDMTHKALERDATLMVEVGYDAPVRKRSMTGSSHQHGIPSERLLFRRRSVD